MTTGPLTGALRETLAVFEAGEPQTTTEVARQLDLGRRSTYERLERLVDNGRLETKKVGSSGRVWWQPTVSAPHEQRHGPASGTAAKGAIDDVFGDVAVGLVVSDADGTVVWTNGAFESQFGLDGETVVGLDEQALVGEHLAPKVSDAAPFMRAVLGGDRPDGAECCVTRGPGRKRRRLELHSRRIPDGPFAGGRVDQYVDVTDRDRSLAVSEVTDRTRELERYRTIVETMNDGVYTVTPDGEFTFVNSRYADQMGTDPEELVGSSVRDFVDGAVADRAAELEAELVAGDRDVAKLEATRETAGGETTTMEATFAIMWLDGENYERVGVVRDITDHKRRERELERRIGQLEAITDLGSRALRDRDLDGLMQEAAELVAASLDVTYAKVLDLDEASEALLLRRGVGWDEGIAGSATVSAVEDDSQAAYTLGVDHPVVVEDLSSERRFSGPDLLRDHDVRSGISAIIGPFEEPWGILGTHDTEPREFSDHDINFVQSVANILANAIRRAGTDRELLSQREQLAALNNLNSIVQGITDAVIDRSTREEIEATVCTHLAESDSYSGAWVGDGTGTSPPLASAGTVPQSADSEAGDEHTGRGPVEVSAAQSSLSIPIVHDEMTYGVLHVYAERAEAFERDEAAVLGRLGEVVGHAIAASERKQALMSDEVVEVRYRIDDVLGMLDLERGSGRITLDQAVPVDDEYLLYGTATEDAVGTVEGLVETLPHWLAVEFRETEGPTRFELRLAEPPVLSVVASLGGTIESAVVEDGRFDLVVQVTPGTDVRALTRAIQAQYPDAQLVSRRQRHRSDRSLSAIQDVLDSDLTERQQAVLQAAYHAGYFDWPREVTGEALAESLGVSSPTFHQHLRKAEQQLFDALLSDTPMAK